MKIQADNYITTEQYRRLCGYSTVSAITAAIRSGRLKAEKFNGRYMIRANEIINTNRTGEFIGLSAKRKQARAELLKQIADAGYDPDEVL